MHTTRCLSLLLYAAAVPHALGAPAPWAPSATARSASYDLAAHNAGRVASPDSSAGLDRPSDDSGNGKPLDGLRAGGMAGVGLLLLNQLRTRRAQLHASLQNVLGKSNRGHAQPDTASSATAAAGLREAQADYQAAKLQLWRNEVFSRRRDLRREFEACKERNVRPFA